MLDIWPAPETPSSASPGASSASAGDIAERLRRLATLGPHELREEWRRLYRTQPPRLSSDLMMRALAYRVQELAFGGLTKATLRRLASLASALDQGKSLPAVPAQQLRAGTRLVREWGGRSHVVLVTEDGFTWQGERYRSLTAIARRITGAHWSGPRFFGLTASPGRERGSSVSVADDGAGEAPGA